MSRLYVALYLKINNIVKFNNLKSILCNISYAINLPQLLGPFGKNKVIALMYHGIVKSYPQNPLKDIYGFNVSVNQFEEQMKYLFTHCNVIKASDAISGQNISYNKKNVVITFDDGYRNNYINAFPILLKYNLPALFSLPTAFIVNRFPLWNDLIEYAVINTKKRVVRIKWDNVFSDFKLDTIIERKEFLKWLLFKCTDITQEARERFISNVFNDLDVPFDNNKILEEPDYEPLSPQEVKILSESKMIEFASHSENHYVLSRVNKDTLINELKNSKIAIEKMTGMPCKYFCIPGGHYNDSVIDTILEAEYEKIFSSDNTEFHPYMDMQNVIGRHCIYKFIAKPLFVDIIHGPFHRMSYALRHLHSKKKQ